jgi:hypothetical protein
MRTGIAISKTFKTKLNTYSAREVFLDSPWNVAHTAAAPSPFYSEKISKCAKKWRKN